MTPESTPKLLLAALYVCVLTATAGTAVFVIHESRLPRAADCSLRQILFPR